MNDKCSAVFSLALALLAIAPGCAVESIDQHATKAGSGVEQLGEDLEQTRQLIEVGSPFGMRILREFNALQRSSEPQGVAFRQRLQTVWQNRHFHDGERPLLLLAALRAALQRQPALPLRPLIGIGADLVTSEQVKTSALRQRFLDSMAGIDEGFWSDLQRREAPIDKLDHAVAWQLVAHWARVGSEEKPLLLLQEFGWQAGFGLIADHLGGRWQNNEDKWFESRPLTVGKRRGVASSADDLGQADAAPWNKASIWPGGYEKDQLLRLERAINRVEQLRQEGTAPTWNADSRLTDMAGIAAAVQEHLSSETTQLESSRGCEASPYPQIIVFQTMLERSLGATLFGAYERAMEHWLRTMPPKTAIWVSLERESFDEFPTFSDRYNLSAKVFFNNGLWNFNLAQCDQHCRHLIVDYEQLGQFQAHVSAR